MWDFEQKAEITLSHKAISCFLGFDAEEFSTFPLHNQEKLVMTRTTLKYHLRICTILGF